MKHKQAVAKWQLNLILLTLLSLFGLISEPDQAQAQAPVAPQVLIHNQSIVAGQISVAKVVIPHNGWVVIHRDQQGKLGTAIGLAPVRAGSNSNVAVAINEELATATLYVLLHSDAGQPNVYEFPGADAPIIVSNPPMLAFQAAALPTQPSAAAFSLYLPVVSHTLTTQGSVTRGANLRAGPGTNFPVVGRARAGQTIALVACDATCSWYQLANGHWVAAFLVQGITPAVAALPQVASP
jgi:Bacterial SH3 domain